MNINIIAMTEMTMKTKTEALNHQAHKYSPFDKSIKSTFNITLLQEEAMRLNFGTMAGWHLPINSINEAVVGKFPWLPPRDYSNWIILSLLVRDYKLDTLLNCRFHYTPIYATEHCCMIAQFQFSWKSHFTFGQCVSQWFRWILNFKYFFILCKPVHL